MAQRLILPINKMRVTAGYKNAKYKQQFGYTHYGVDVTDAKRTDKTIWASGKGIVTHCGWHPTGGNVVVIVYKDCRLFKCCIEVTFYVAFFISHNGGGRSARNYRNC